MPRGERRIAEIAVLGVMVLWGANFIVVKSALAVLPPVGFTFLRFVLASITLFVCSAGGKAPSACRGGTSWPSAGSARSLRVYQISGRPGLTTVPAGDSALIIASTPCWSRSSR